MWLRDFLPVDLRDANVRILTFGYNSALRDSTSTGSLHDFSRQLMDGVNSARSDAEKARTANILREIRANIGNRKGAVQLFLLAIVSEA
jgi:hypothetical protein